MANKNVTDMTVGNPTRHILKFTIPLLIGNLFQQLYNTADAIIVGKFVGKQALAAVGGSEHAAKLGVLLAWRFIQDYPRPAYTLNPTNVDEYIDLARLTGIRGLYRRPHSHVLNPKAVAEAEAEANRTIAASLTPEIIENKKLEKWNGELPKVTGGNAFVELGGVE